MNTKQSLGLATASVLASMVSMSAHAYAPSDDGLSRAVEIENNSPYAIVKLEAQNVADVGSWHTYLNRVKVGQSSTTEIDDGMGYCRFDVHVIFADGSDAYLWNVNVCNASSLSFG